jgi:hypothetical protein
VNAVAITESFTALAHQHDLGVLTDDVGTRLFGRNANYCVGTDRGEYFVKKFQYADAEVKLRNCLAYDTFVARFPDGGLPRSPRCLVADVELGVLVQEFRTDAKSGAELMVDEAFGPEISAKIGTGLASLHAAGIDGLERTPERPTPAPAVRLLDGIPLRLIHQLTGGELQAYGMLQADSDLVAALRALAADSEAATRTAVHGDLRVDQILVDDDVWIVDWEEFGTGDPARDTGSFLGEWLYRTILDIPTSRGGSPAMARADGAETVIRRGHEKAEVLAPIPRAFWNSYRSVRDVDEGFVERTGAFAGWHLLDRLVAGAVTSAVLPAMHRAAAGVGRSAVLNPRGIYRFLGLEDRP